MSDLSPINFVTGTLGSGKSYFAMRYVRDYLREGKIVATNFELTGEWWRTWSKSSGLLARLRADEQADYMRGWQMRENAYRFDVPDDLYDFRLPGEGEDRGLIVLDEGALRMNSREWASRAKDEKERYGTGLRSLQWYINMRKLGWSCLILAHSEDQLDNQVRAMGGAIIRCRNLKKLKIPVVGWTMFRKPRFVAVHVWPETKPVHIYKREIYGLNLSVATHYRSLEQFEANPQTLGIRYQSRRVKLAVNLTPFPNWDAVAGRRPAPGVSSGGPVTGEEDLVGTGGG